MVEARKLEKVAEREVRDMAKFVLDLEGELDELVEELFTPEREGYAWSWAEVAGEVVGETLEENDLGLFPKAGAC